MNKNSILVIGQDNTLVNLAARFTASCDSARNDISPLAVAVVLSDGAVTQQDDAKLMEAKGAIHAFQQASEVTYAVKHSYGVRETVAALVIQEDLLDTVEITRPCNVPTLVIKSYRQLGLAKDDYLLVQCALGDFYVNVQKVTPLPPQTPELVQGVQVTAKITGTLLKGLVANANATTSGRVSATKQSKANKPKSDTSKADNAATKRKPRGKAGNGSVGQQKEDALKTANKAEEYDEECLPESDQCDPAVIGEEETAEKLGN